MARFAVATRTCLSFCMFYCVVTGSTHLPRLPQSIYRSDPHNVGEVLSIFDSVKFSSCENVLWLYNCRSEFLLTLFYIVIHLYPLRLSCNIEYIQKKIIMEMMIINVLNVCENAVADYR